MKRIEDIERSRTISDAELLKAGAKYELDPKTQEKRLVPSPEQIREIEEKVEELLASGMLTPELLSEAEFNATYPLQEGMPFDYEVEREQRAYVRNDSLPIGQWKNHIIDYYDASGRIRIRSKNGSLIFGLKIPLFSQDTETSKSCIRLQLKPITDSHKEILGSIQGMLADEPGSIRKEKFGTQITLKNGQKAWLNKNDKEEYWVEAESGVPIEALLPEGLEFLEYRKSEIKIKP